MDDFLRAFHAAAAAAALDVRETERRVERASTFGTFYSYYFFVFISLVSNRKSKNDGPLPRRNGATPLRARASGDTSYGYYYCLQQATTMHSFRPPDKKERRIQKQTTGPSAVVRLCHISRSLLSIFLSLARSLQLRAK